MEGKLEAEVRPVLGTGVEGGPKGWKLRTAVILTKLLTLEKESVTLHLPVGSTV